MCNNSRPRLSKDLVCDSMSDKRSNMLLAQPDILGQISKCYLAAYWESVCQPKSRHSLLACEVI